MSPAKELPHTHGRTHAKERGANLIEFALSAMVLLMLIAGTVDFGGAFQNYIIITNAAREGARTASRLPCTSSNRAAYKSAVVSAAIAEAALSNIILVAADVSYTPNLATTCPAAGSPVIVSVRHIYASQFAALIGVASINLVGRVEMLFFGNDVGFIPAAEPIRSLQRYASQKGEAPC